MKKDWITPETRSLSWELFRRGLPMIAGTLITALYNVVDAFWVSQLGVKELAAVTLCGPLGLTGIGIGMMFGSGLNSCLARFFGAGKLEKASRYASTVLATGTLLMALLVILLEGHLPHILAALGSTEETSTAALSYSRIFFPAQILTAYCLIVNNIAVSRGHTLVSMQAMLLAGACNMLLDPLFIFVFAGGVQGAAWATLLSQLFSAVRYTVYAGKTTGAFRVSLKAVAPSLALYKDVLEIGTPFLFYQLLGGASMALTNALLIPYGVAAVAAMGVTTKITNLASETLVGFVEGYSPLAGKSCGAGDHAKARFVTQLAIFWSTLFLTLFAALCFCFPDFWISFFASEGKEVLAIGRPALRIAAVALVTVGFQAVVNNYFLALGKARQGFVLGVVFQSILYLPMLLVMHYAGGLWGILWAIVPTDLLGTLMAYYYWNQDKKDMNHAVL